MTGQVTAREYDEGDHVVAFKFVNDKGELVDSLTGKYGTISIDKDGNYTYTFNNGQAQHLGAGEMAAEHFNVVAVDTYGAQTTTPSDLQIQIQGTNDAPVITSRTQPDGTGQRAGRNNRYHHVQRCGQEGRRNLL